MVHRTCTVALIATLAGLSAACDGITGAEGSGEARVLLSRSQSGAAQVLATDLVDQSRAEGLSLESVSAIDVTLDRVELHRADVDDAEEEGDGPPGEGDGAGGWVSLDVEEASLDLMALPEDGGVQVASGDVEAGGFDRVRLFVSSASVTLAEQVEIGAATTLEPGTYDLTIPSADQTGIKVNLTLDVQAGESGTVQIAFEAGTSVQTVTWTADGLLMSPVLVAKGEADVDSGP